MGTDPWRVEALAEAKFVGKPWDRQVSPPWAEGDKAYDAFRIWLDTEENAKPSRLLAAANAYREKYGCTQTTAEKNCYKWRQTHRWEERLAAYEAEVDAIELRARKREIIRASRKHADRMAEAQETLMEPLRVYRERLAQVAAGLRESGFEELDEDGNPKFTDADLQEIGRASLRVIMEAQKEQRAALGIDAPATVDNKRIEMRGAILRRVLSDESARTRLEEVAFQVAAEERSEQESG